MEAADRARRCLDDERWYRDGLRLMEASYLRERTPAGRLRVWGHRGAVEMLSHQLERLVAPGGRLLVSNYVPAEQRDRYPAVVLDRLGFRMAGVTAPGDSGERAVPPTAWVRSRGTES